MRRKGSGCRLPSTRSPALGRSTRQELEAEKMGDRGEVSRGGLRKRMRFVHHPSGRYVDLMKFWYDRDGVGPRWPWYFEPALALP